MKSFARVAFLALAASPALMAHPGHAESGFVAGAAHPISGFDHLLAMVAVGLLGVRSGGKALWALPLTFMTGMLLGGLLAVAGVGIPAAEWGIALSVLAFGGFVALASSPNVWLSGSVVGLFALMHGHAHAAEMSGDQNFALYATGFLIATAMLHATGVFGGLALKRIGTSSLVRFSGAAIAVCSGIFVVDLIS